MDAATMSSDSLTSTLVNEDTISLQPTEISARSNGDGTDEDTDVGNITDSDDEDTCETQERHEDHWDAIYFKNPWTDEDGADWRNTWVLTGRKSVTNEELFENPTTRRWMEEFASMRRDNISLLIKARGYDSCSVPLFEDANGWQYQVRLGIGGHSLPTITCPSVLSNHTLRLASLFQLRTRIQSEPNQTVDNTSTHTPPRFASPLGILTVRSDARHPGYFAAGEYVTEDTDYTIVVDVEHDDMPLWILAPRPQLQKRLDNPFYFHPVYPLSIFDGLLLKEGDCGYDCACILPSLRRLGRQPPEPDAPSFQDACELVRKTRAIIDPAALSLSEERVREFAGDEAISHSFVALRYSELGSQQEEKTQGDGEEAQTVAQE